MLVRTALLAALLASPAMAEPTHFKLVSSGVMKKIGQFNMSQVKLSETKPDSIKKLPEGLSAKPLFGTLTIAGPAGATYNVILDEPEGKPAKLYVDSNGNGDMTDDGAAELEAGSHAPIKYEGGMTLHLGTGDTYNIHLGLYRLDKSTPQGKHYGDVLLFYSDYATEGQLKLGGETYPAMLLDVPASGDYSEAGKGDTVASRGSAMLFIDRNKNGKIDGPFEMYDVHKPFNIGGTTYELKDLTKDGLSFEVVKSEKTVAEVKAPPPPPDLAIGKPVLAFEAKTMDGKDVKFPETYKGKIVLLDFWATWCNPCMGEVPNVVAAYEKYHGKGFEILGITLDQANAADKVTKVTGEHKMTWEQVYDGKGWSARIAELYGIHSIPAAYLVDGDTGKILAEGEALRGPKGLADAVEKALASKNKS